MQILVDAKLAIAQLKQARKRAARPSLALARTSVFIKEQIDQGFTEQRDPYGNVWLPLKDSTLRLRQRSGNPSTAVLTDTGAMRDSLQANPSATSIQISIDDFASVHQSGNPANLMFGKASAPLPMRRIFPIIDDNVVFPKAWEDQIDEYFSNLIAEVFSGSSVV